MAASKRSLNPLVVLLLLSSLFFIVFLLVSGAYFLYRSPVGMRHNASSGLFSSGAVGLIEVNGVIMDSKKTLSRLERFEEDEQVKAVVVRLNSPGGSVAPSQEIYEAMKKYKKPVVVSMSSVAASGAYYIACGAKKVFANPGTITGSIGVIMEFANLQRLYEWSHVHRYSIKTGKYKDAGAEYRDMSAEERELFQAMIDDVLGQFKQAVGEARGLSEDEVTAIADGRVFSGQQAKKLNLVDELGTIDEAIHAAAELAHLKGKPQVIRAEKTKKSLLDLIPEDSSQSGESSLPFSSSKNKLVQIISLLKLFPHLLGSDLGSSPQLDEIKAVAPEPFVAPGMYSIWGGMQALKEMPIQD